FLSVCDSLDVPVSDVDELLGRSILDLEETGERSYSKGSAQYKVLARSLSHDRSFLDYWNNHHLDLETLNELGENEKASKVRKVYPIVLMRDFFRAPTMSRLALQQTRRSRKTLEIYAGAGSLMTIAEG